MDEQTRKAFDFAQDTTKQLMTLATGIVAIGITFSKDFAGAASSAARGWMSTAWLLYTISILFGVYTLLALTGLLGRETVEKGSIYQWNVRGPSAVQILIFVFAVIATLIAGKMAVDP